MYRSPIDIIYGQMETQIEGAILRAVQKCDVNVDKEELIRALQYDRGQYEKGFQEGLKNARTWIPVSERYPTEAEANEHGDVLVATSEGYVLIAFFEKVYEWDFITHWMELPAAPKHFPTGDCK